MYGKKVLMRMEWSIQDVYKEIELLLSGEDIHHAALPTYIKPGKCIRSKLIKYCGTLCNSEQQDLFQLAIAVELLHIASLIHDDVLHQCHSHSKRGLPAFNTVLSIHEAVLLGDWVLGVVMEIVSELPKPVRYQIAKIIQHLIRGEWRKKERKDILVLDESMYFEHIYDKTAYFIAMCCKMPAELSPTDSNYSDILTAYGYYLGMAFQIRDDLLDYVGICNSIGKPYLRNWNSQTVTLPFIHHLKEREKSGHSFTNWKEVRHEYSQLDVEKLEETNSFRYTLFKLQTFVQKAVSTLEAIPSNPLLEEMQQIALDLVQPRSIKHHVEVGVR
jgi:geranylgeranyl pyrophosphate synthase